jgi:TatD DNase family protein
MLKIEETSGFLAEMDKKLAHHDCIAIGESGLNKNSCFSPEDQLMLFRAQMELSVKHQLPVIIHCVGRWNELERLFKEKTHGSPEWIIHGFRKAKLAQKFLDLGANLSFGRALLYDKHLHALLPAVPVERIFLETDGEEMDINDLYAKLAELKSLPLQVVTERIYANFRRVFYRNLEV